MNCCLPPEPLLPPGVSQPQKYSRPLPSFFRTGASLDWSLLADKSAFACRLCIANFRSRLGGGDRFDDWVVGRQFVPDCLHHPVSANRTFSKRVQIRRIWG